MKGKDIGNFYRKLAERYGTPVIVYLESDILKRISAVKKAFSSYSKFKLLYTLKANSNRTLVKTICSPGVGIDASSPGDSFIAMKYGIKSKEIFATGPNWSKEDITYFIRNGIKVDLDSISAIKIYGELMPHSEIGIRINPGQGFAFANHLSSGDINSKLGIPINELYEAKTIAKKFNLKIKRIHYHVFSGCLEYKGIVKVFKKSAEIAKNFPDLEEVNIGGGWGVPFTNKEKELDISKLSKGILRNLLELNKFFKRKLRLIVELGEYVINPAGYAIGTITSIKRTKNKLHVGTNLNSNFIPGFYLYKTEYPLLDEKKEGLKATIGGNLCQAGDIIAEDRILKNPKVGKILVFGNVGAYATCRNSRFNSRLKPTEILIKANGDTKIIYKDRLENLL